MKPILTPLLALSLLAGSVGAQASTRSASPYGLLQPASFSAAETRDATRIELERQLAAHDGIVLHPSMTTEPVAALTPRGMVTVHRSDAKAGGLEPAQIVLALAVALLLLEALNARSLLRLVRRAKPAPAATVAHGVLRHA